MSPAPTQEDIRNGFRTYANYLDAFAMCCRTPYNGKASPFEPQLEKDLPALAKYCGTVSSMGGHVAGGGAQLDVEAVKGSLANAWGSELMLGIGSPLQFEDGMIRLLNNWGVIQAYYSAYHAFQALLLAQRRPRPESHPSTQRQFSAQWCDTKLDLPPWSSGFGDSGFVNDGMAPTAVNPKIQVWTGCEPLTCWSLVAVALRTTRAERVKDATSSLREEKRKAEKKAWRAKYDEKVAKGKSPKMKTDFSLPRLTSAEKAAVSKGVRPFTVLDFLYRLRIKTNYVDAQMFTEGPETPIESLLVRANLIALTASTLLVHELHVGALVGKATLMDWIDTWAAQNDVDSLTLGLRRDFIEANLP